MQPLVYAHRGGAALRPENTIAAFDNGLAIGADGLEFDVRLTRDGVVVVHHDETLDRTTNGRGLVATCTAADLTTLDAAHWFRPHDAAGGHPDGSGETSPKLEEQRRDFPFRGQGICIPLLRDVLTRYRGIPLIIELKQNQPELAERTIDEVRAARAVDHVALGSFYWRVLQAAREYEPRIATGASREETRWALYRSWVGWPLRDTAYREFQVPERSGNTTVISPRFVRHAHNASIAVKAWTVNHPDDMRRLMGFGVDAIISDRPDTAVRIVKSEG